MQEFIFTSDRFKGSMRFVYNNDGVLELFENNAELSDIQINFFGNYFPFRLENLIHFKGEKGTITEVTNLSFDIFWNKYDHKVDKALAKEYWAKMSKEDKLAAFVGIPKYKYRCKLDGTAILYPIRYLKRRRWEDGK